MMEALSEVCHKFAAEGVVHGGDKTQPSTERAGWWRFLQETLMYIRVTDHSLGEKLRYLRGNTGGS